ncbi:glycerol-3-phosphate acyltransferase [Lysinibacillus alkalisoli]|uniref:Glycerol-3-phosphate acyltransferase n=1 Tax=Lysinibacillus alkalisoli TaxID=1911548 RepID=A0A917G6J1_9BACI|nr:glycerol-3-phosphate acyltransferase [Lysinibacillus alkalisoli]GGG25330.1 glycerol-3-phosphate acyltransferase [Lysinibacillus alkalisoli]
MLFALICTIISGYFIGCIHGSVIAQKLSGINLKTQGSGNAGASNATLLLGWKYGILVAIIDIFKALFAVIIARYLFSYYHLSDGDSIILLYVLSAFVIIGHNFPFHMKFNGGKGTASLIGAFLALYWPLGLLGTVAFVIIGLLTNYLIIGLFAIYLIFIVSAYYLGGWLTCCIALLLFIITCYLHIPNIKNVYHGTEPKVRNAFKKKVP